MNLLLSVSPQEIANKLDAVTAFFEGAQKVAVIFTSFLTVGLGGALLAFRGIKAQIRSVEKRVDPAVADTSEIRREVSTDTSDTLRQKVEGIAAAMDAEKVLRETQHESNSERLDHLVEDVRETKDDIKEMRTLLMKLLGKTAGL